MENLFNADSYSITEAFAYAGVQSPFGTFQIPYSWGPILWGACLAILIAGIIFRLMQKYLVRAELSMPKGKGYLSIAIMAVLGVTWIILWTLIPWISGTPFRVLMNVGAVGLFASMTIFMIASIPFYSWDTIDVEAIEEEARANLENDLNE